MRQTHSLLRADRLPLGMKPADLIARAALAHLRQRARLPVTDLDQMALRAVSEPATSGSGDAGWDDAGRTALLSWLAASPAAAGALIGRAMRVELRPGEFTASVTNLGLPALGWREEGAPIQVLGAISALVPLAAKSLAGLVVVSRELLRRSDAGALIDAALRRSAARAIENLMFSATAATTAAPAGLLVGVTPAASTESLGGDLGLLARLVGDVSNTPVFIGSSENAWAARVAGIDVFSSAALPEGRVIAVAPEALAVVVDPEVTIETSADSTLHMSDVPAELVTDAPATADPIRSMLQTGAISLRLMIGINWAPVITGAVAIVDGAFWQ
jgi:hypothetical protein